MAYIVEPWDSVNLSLSVGPYTIPSDPLALTLDFADSEPPPPPLPWELPTLVVEYRAPIRRAGASQGSTAVLLTRATPADDVRGAGWSQAEVALLEAGLAFEESTHRDSVHASPWGQGEPLHAARVSQWSQSSPVDRVNLSIVWGQAVAFDRPGYVAGWVMKTPARDTTVGAAWFSVHLTGTPYDDSALERALLNTDTATTVTLAGLPGPFEVREWNEVHFRFGYVAPKRPSVPNDVEKRITARQATPRDDAHTLPWGAGQSAWQDWNLPYPVEDNEEPEPPGPLEPPEVKKVYLVMNTLQIVDVATSTPLDIQDVRIGLDYDSLSWTFSGTVYGQASLDLVIPDGSGMKDLAVTINTHQWIFTIESYNSDERFPSKKWQISGVSRTQYMAAPLAPTRSYTNASATTAAQAANAELQNTGYTLAWPTGSDGDLPDWPIPAGALSYRDKTPAQVVAMIVKAAGGVMVPAMAADSWTIHQRYTTPPWQWDTVTPDVGIYVGMIRSRSGKYEAAQEHNACFVSGVNQGQSVDVQRQGSGGTDPMPDIFEDLITDAQPAISRGRNELAATGNKVIETLQVPIFENGAAPGVLVPGQIAQVQHDDSLKDYVGLVLSNSISVAKAGGAQIYQSVTLERTA